MSVHAVEFVWVQFSHRERAGLPFVPRLLVKVAIGSAVPTSEASIIAA